MSITLDKSVREIATETPSSIRVFETLGIDYCCRGAKTLEQACADQHLPAEDVMKKLEKAAAESTAGDVTDWATASLTELMQHIVRKHHQYVRQELVRLEALCAKVQNKHGHAHPELKRVAALFLTLRDEMSSHMIKEEQILFPHVARLERVLELQQPARQPGFGMLANPVQVMIHEHDDAGSLLSTIRRLSNDYVAPADACVSYQALCEGLQAFERDLHQHIHLENNILFPRALQMETESAVRQ